MQHVESLRDQIFFQIDNITKADKETDAPPDKRISAPDAEEEEDEPELDVEAV
jgi:hypothetical protein